MALKKTTITDNGLPLEYHNIQLVNVEPNRQVTLLVNSYLNEDARLIEKEHILGQDGEYHAPFYAYEYVNIPWDDAQELLDGLLERAYDLLRHVRPELKDAESV